MATSETMAAQNPAAMQDGLSKGRLVGYGVADMGFSLVWCLVSSFLTYFYTDVAGIAAGAIGTIMLFSRLLDGVTDIGMGLVVDRTKSKHGKARPWVMRMAIPLAASLVLLFTIPNVGNTGKLVYVAITYNVLLIVYTAATIPYNTLLSLITKNQYQRSLANLFRMFFALCATVLAASITLPLANGLGGGVPGWIILAGVYGLVMVAVVFIMFKNTREVVTHASEAKDKVPVKTAVKGLFKNKYWVIMLLLCVISYTGSGLSSAGVYYTQYILGNTNYMGLLSIAGMIPMVLGMLVSAPLLKRFGKRNAALAGMCLAMVGQIIKIANPANLTQVLVSTVIGALGAVPLSVSLYAMINDTVEYGEWKTGVRSEGLVNSAASFGIKVGTGVGTALVGWLLGLGGYIGGAAVQSAAAIRMIKVLTLYIPTGLQVVTMVLLVLYKLDKEYVGIVADLEKRRNQKDV